MKRILVFALILIIPAIVLYTNDADYSLRDLSDMTRTDLDKSHPYSAYRWLKKDSLRVAQKQKDLDPKWEYIKNTLFNHVFENRRVYFPDKLRGPILLVLENATKQDSLAFNSVMKEVRVLIPTKTIAFFSDFIGMDYHTFTQNKENEAQNYSYKEIVMSTLKIRMNDPNKIKIAKAIEHQNFDASNLFKNYRNFMWVFLNQSTYLDFVFDEDISFVKRKQYIQYKFLNALCLTYPMSSRIGPTKSYPMENIFNWQNRSPWNREFTEMDKFLLQKLYADDFEKQFSDYMYKAYSWRYASYFLNTGLAKLKAFVIVFLIGLLAFISSFGYFQYKTYRFTYLNYLSPCLAIAIHLANLIVIYLYIVNMELTRYVEQLSAGYLIAIGLALIYSFLLWCLERLLIKKTFDFSYQLALKMLITFFVFNLPLLIGYVVYDVLLKPESNHISKPEELYLPVFIVLFGFTLARGFLIYLNHFSESLVKQKDVELSRLKEINAQSELKLLQSHINPHFLYNALNSIAGLVHTSPGKSEQMALSLSNLFRYSINKKGQQLSTVNEEVVMVQNYLDIEKIRFGERLTFTLKIEESLKNKEIPMYILQPLVENAIKHGVSKIREEGEIELQIKTELKNLIISVSDNGPDFPEGLVSGHGLQTVYDLLRLSYGDQASLQWKNKPVKKIEVKIPLKN